MKVNPEDHIGLVKSIAIKQRRRFAAECRSIIDLVISGAQTARFEAMALKGEQK